MRLYEHEDFEQAMLRAAEHHGLSEQFVEKDYYITEILRIVVAELEEKVIFKGGHQSLQGLGLDTTLLGGHRPIRQPRPLDPRPGKNKVNKILKRLTERVAEYPPLEWRREEGETIKGLGRNDVLACQPEVRSMLASPEYEAIRLDYDLRSREFFTRAYRPPPDLSFKESAALFPDPGLRARLEPEYERQCALLFSDQDYASFDEVLARFEEIRELL